MQTWGDADKRCTLQGWHGSREHKYSIVTVLRATLSLSSDGARPWKQSATDAGGSWSKPGFYFFFLLSSSSPSPPSHLPEYQGTFQSCFHFGDSYRMDQTAVSGVPADSHAYTPHQQNGFHVSPGNTGVAGSEETRFHLTHQKRPLHQFHVTEFILPSASRLQPDTGAAGRLPVLVQPRGEHFLPGGQLRPQPEPHVVRLHRDVEQQWGEASPHLRPQFFHSCLMTFPPAPVSFSHKIPHTARETSKWTIESLNVIMPLYHSDRSALMQINLFEGNSSDRLEENPTNEFPSKGFYTRRPVWRVRRTTFVSEANKT